MGKPNKKRNTNYRKAENRKKRTMNKNNFPVEKWENLNELVRIIAEPFSAYSQILDLIRIPELMAEVENKASLENKLEILAKDISHCNEEIRLIIDQHKDKTGIVTEDDFTTYLLIGQQYYNLQSKIEENIALRAVEILEQLNVAEEKLRAKIKAFNEQTDPNVVSDAQIVSTQTVN